jgi:hypothetical protein
MNNVNGMTEGKSNCFWELLAEKLKFQNFLRRMGPVRNRRSRTYYGQH